MLRDVKGGENYVWLSGQGTHPDGGGNRRELLRADRVGGLVAPDSRLGTCPRGQARAKEGIGGSR